MSIGEIWRKIAGAHRSDDQTEGAGVAEFFVPKFTAGFFIRAGAVALLAILIFGFVLRPCIINGASMLPNWPEHGFTFCWTPRYLFSPPRRGDVVIVRYSSKVFYLKRVVGLPGDTVAFWRGNLYVNGKRVKEPYVKYISNWNLRPRQVEPGHYYVVGDNRSQPIHIHKFGQVRASRIIGAPLF